MVEDSLSRKYEDVEALLCVISIIQPDWVVEAMGESAISVDTHSKDTKGS